MNYLDSFNNIVEKIEENIHEDIFELYDIVAKSVGMSKRDTATVFKYIHGSDYATYIKQRKIYRIAQRKMENPEETWSSIAGAFSLFEYSTFNRQFKAFVGIKPEEFPEQYTGNIWDKRPAHLKLDEEKVFVEIERDPEVVYVQMEKGPFFQEMQMPENFETGSGGGRQMGEYILDAVGMSNPFFTKEEMESYVDSEIAENPKTREMMATYETFMELEECRAVYGFTVKEIMYLYLKNNCDSKSLYRECERICDEAIEEMIRRYDEGPDWDEWEEEHYSEEMNLSEAYEYYYGDE